MMLFVFLFALLFLPNLVQRILTYRRVKNQASLPVGWSFVLAFVAGLIVPLLAFFSAVSSLSTGSEVKPACVTGAGSFLFIGYLVTFTLTPLIGIIGALLSINRSGTKQASGHAGMPF